MMTKAQTALYWREWAAVRKAQLGADRHELHRRALGRECSSKEFGNRELDLVLAEFRAISRPASVNAQLRQIRQPRARMVHKITVEQAALLRVFQIDPEPYIAAILRDRFHADSIDDLSEHKPHPDQDSPLEQLRSTLARAIDRQRKAAGYTVHETYWRANYWCPHRCKTCENIAARYELAGQPVPATPRPLEHQPEPQAPDLVPAEETAAECPF